MSKMTPEHGEPECDCEHCIADRRAQERDEAQFNRGWDAREDEIDAMTARAEAAEAALKEAEREEVVLDRSWREAEAKVAELQAIVDASQRKMWLAFRLGQFQLLHHGYSGRDALRALKTDWDHLELPEELWPDFEKEIMQNDHPVGMLLSTTIRRAIAALAGRDCPWMGESAALAAQAQKVKSDDTLPDDGHSHYGKSYR